MISVPVPEKYEMVASEIEECASQLKKSSLKGELGILLSKEVLKYSIFDLQVIGGRIRDDIMVLPEPYRTYIRPYFEDQIFGAYHNLLSMYRKGTFDKMTQPLLDPGEHFRYWDMVPSGCFVWDEETTHRFLRSHPKYRLFYYLIAAFSMYILDKPGHPVGMPFPGGQKVIATEDGFFCPIRDKEKDVFFSICNFCPAKQTPE